MKKFINKILNVPKLILTIWIILWVILIVLLIMKFCFDMWYPIVTDNIMFINMCDYIDKTKWLSIMIMFIFYFLNLNILILLNMGKTKYSNWYIPLIFNLLIVATFILKMQNNTTGFVFEMITLFFSFSIINIKQHNFDSNLKNILVPIVNYALLNLWQFTMLVVRGTDGLLLSNLPSLIYIILQFDYYIFVIISWIGVSHMGLLGAGWFWSKDVTVLKAEKEKELAKKRPDSSKLAKLDERIAELEKEEK